jgi:hypothetical protein
LSKANFPDESRLSDNLQGGAEMRHIKVSPVGVQQRVASSG